jgi:hypothetical protein
LLPPAIPEALAEASLFKTLTCMDKQKTAKMKVEQ